MNDPRAGFAVDAACFHCGLAVDAADTGRWSVSIDGVMRPMCCAGCEAVARAIVDAGLHDYYRHRSAPAASASDPQAPLRELQRLGLYDDAQVQRQFARDTGEGMECALAVEGMRCGACVWLIERALREVPGVQSITVNYATERATLRWSPQTVKLSVLLDRIRDVGYRALPFDARAHEQERVQASRVLFRRLFVASLGMMQVMMYAVPAYTAGPDGIDADIDQLFRWASLLLTTPVVLYSAVPFFAGAWRDLRSRHLGMDTPVALGIGAAFAASTVATVTGQGEVYFDSVSMFVALLLGARWLEWVIRRRAGRAVDTLTAALPDAIERVMPDGSTVTVAAVQAQVGDRFRVAAGERIALDARVLQGDARVDQSLLTGESMPVSVAPGGEIPGGSVNAGDPFIAEVLRGPRDSVPSVMQRLIDRAASDKPRIAAMADRIAAAFVLALLLLAAATWLYWHGAEPARALPIAIAVLVVSCPCALSLATPAALAAATGALLGRGLTVTRGQTLEALSEVTDVVFDKTGTLTRGRPTLVDVTCMPQADRLHALRVAVALEAGSTHPLAIALREALSDTPPAAELSRSHPGQGVSGQVDGTRYVLGNAQLAGMQATADGVTTDGPAHASEVWLGRVEPAPGSADDTVTPLARFTLVDELREDAAPAIAALRASGLTVHLLSGDREAAVRHAAQALDIERWRAQARPDDKLAYVEALQRAGRRVLMVGDGLNDAPVLAAADASIAVSEASALARVAADIVSVRPGITQVVDAVGTARRTRRVIAQNLGWALAYNALAIPAAAIGWVPPWVAAVGMSVSSLAVALNAMRLWSWKRSTY